MLLSIDGTFIVQLINFIVFFALVNVLFIRPVREAIIRRRAYIDGVNRELKQYTDEVHELRHQGEQARARARHEAAILAARTHAEALDGASAIAEEYASRARTIFDEADEKVATEVHEARGRADALATELARRMLEQALPQEAVG